MNTTGTRVYDYENLLGNAFCETVLLMLLERGCQQEKTCEKGKENDNISVGSLTFLMFWGQNKTLRRGDNRAPNRGAC
jgi:hypothetical protein